MLRQVLRPLRPLDRRAQLRDRRHRLRQLLDRLLVRRRGHARSVDHGQDAYHL